MFHDRQPESESAVLPRRRPVGLAERLEDVREEFARDSAARVGDRDLDTRRRATHTHVNRAVVRRELDGVGQQVPHDLLQPRGVTLNRGDRRVGVDRDVDPMLVGFGLHDLERTTNRLVDVDRGLLEPKLARHDARHVEELVDDLRLRLGAVVDRLTRAIAPPFVDRAAAEHVGPAEDGVERRPQLV